MIRIVIHGVLGRMGRTLAYSLQGEESIQLVAGLEVKGHPLVGKDIGEVLGIGKVAPIVDRAKEAIENADCVVEFTNPEATLEHLRLASSAGVPCVVGTTGFTDGQMSQIRDCASSIPCVLSANMALGVNLMFKLAREISALLPDCDCEIVEAHHREKKDSPSGTALKLAEMVGKARGKKVSEIARYGRRGSGARAAEEVGIHSIRAGEIVGEHTVLWACGGERIAISHTTFSRDAFARGTLKAIKWVVKAAPGLYTMEDVLGL